MAFALARKYEQKKKYKKKYCLAKKYCKKKYCKKEMAKKEIAKWARKTKRISLCDPGGKSREKREQDTLNLNYENQGCYVGGGAGGMVVGVGVAVDF